MEKHSICIPIQAKTINELDKKLAAAEVEADFIEIWLDYLEDLEPKDVVSIVKKVKKPLIVVCKGRKERGNWRKSEAKRIEMLKAAKKAGADYVDIGIHTDKKLISSLKRTKGKSRLIVSFHDFKKTPSKRKLEQIIADCYKLGAHIAKIATFANNNADNLTILELVAANSLEKNKIIGLCMGKHGEISRIHSTAVGGFLMFAPLSKTSNSAPGQLTVKELKKEWAEL